MGGTAVTSCLGVCGFVNWQAGILDKKLSAVQTELTNLSNQKLELPIQLSLLLGQISELRLNCADLRLELRLNCAELLV